MRIVFDDAQALAVAYRDDEAVGELSIDDSARTPLLVRLYVEPAYRRSGIAHTHARACVARARRADSYRYAHARPARFAGMDDAVPLPRARRDRRRRLTNNDRKRETS
ncbi:GNAT family N-acetyltransferase [Burkholderia multivorans]|uniref:GNAT family N-acetyltransferase n=1 Tax=Burkholderia multivorans TaxID=87883 RepID=UPI0021598456|nr:GNAT family N-acetyltransferase [Burkholderia multivorans]